MTKLRCMNRILILYLILIALIGSINPSHLYAQRYTNWQSGQFFFDDSSRRVVLKMNCPIESCETKINSILQTWNLAKDSVVISKVSTSTFVVFLSNFYAISRLELISSRLRTDTSVVFFSPTYYKNKKPICAPTFEIIVKLKQNETITSLNDDLSSFNLTIARVNPYDSSMIVLNGNKYTNIINVTNSMHQSGKYIYCIPNWIITSILSSNPVNDEFFFSQWGLHTPGMNNNNGGTNVVGAWNYSKGCSNVNIALLDQGIDVNHEDLVDNLLPGYNFVSDNTNVAYDVGERHATACAGIIAAKANNSFGIAGIAPKCKLIPIKVFDRLVNTTVEKIALAIDYAWSNGQASILSCSWGFDSGVEPQPIREAIIRATTQGRGGKGAVVVFATGNDNLNQPHFPSNMTEVIGVGSSTQCNSRKSILPVSCDGVTDWGSNYGTGLDIVAPGVGIYTTDNTGSDGFTNSNYFSDFGGTSSAAPHVAGVVALMLSMNNNLTLSQVKHHLFASASKVGGYNYQVGGGDLNYTWNEEMGYGKINASNAVASVSNLTDLGIEAQYTASYNPQNPPNTILQESEAWFNYFYSAPRCCGELLTITGGSTNPAYANWTGSWVLDPGNPYVQVVSNSGNTIQIYYDQLEWPSQYFTFKLRYNFTGPCGQTIKAVYCFKNIVAGPYQKKYQGELPYFDIRVIQPRVFPSIVNKNSEFNIEIPSLSEPHSEVNSYVLIFDSYGRLIKRQNLNSMGRNMKISTEGFSSGIYIVKLYVKEKQTTFKIIVQ